MPTLWNQQIRGCTFLKVIECLEKSKNSNEYETFENRLITIKHWLQNKWIDTKYSN